MECKSVEDVATQLMAYGAEEFAEAAVLPRV